MIPALTRWNGDHAITKDTTKEAAEALFFDDWYDAIEEGVRARVRCFIETMLEAEPRYGRRRLGRTRRHVGCRRAQRASRGTLTVMLGKTRIAVPRAESVGRPFRWEGITL